MGEAVMLPAYVRGGKTRHFVSKRQLTELIRPDSEGSDEMLVYLEARAKAVNRRLPDGTSIFDLGGLPLGAPIVTYCGRRIPWRPDGPPHSEVCKGCLHAIAEPYRERAFRGTA